MIPNALGRLIPREVNGREAVPFKGVGKHEPAGRKQAPPIRSCRDYPADGDKRVDSLEEAFRRCGLSDGMVISSHHHLRDGDRVGMMALEAAARLGVKDVMWFPSASFPCQTPVIDLMEAGAVHHIEGSLNGPLGDYCSRGRMRGLGVLRSHGGRWQAIQDGEVKIDVAVIAAPSADPFGNCDGSHGPSACGSLGFALADSIYAEHVIVVTDHLVPFPCIPWQIQGNNVDYVVEVDSIGDPEKIVSGTTRITRSPERLMIARNVASLLKETGIMREGFSFQAGAGGIALAFVDYLAELMREAGVKARFVRGGSTRYLVELLEEGLTDYILDGQTFDLDGVRSIGSDPRHVATSPFTSYNFHGKGNFASMVDAVVLGATEVDVHFNPRVELLDPGRALLPGPYTGDQGRGHDGHRTRRADRRRGYRAGHRHQPPAPGPVGRGPWIRSPDPADRGHSARGGAPVWRQAPERPRDRCAGSGDQVGRRDGDRYRLPGRRVGLTRALPGMDLRALPGIGHRVLSE
jgi:citrate lyase subunit alpha/citrate CoA-transferase